MQVSVVHNSYRSSPVVEGLVASLTQVNGMGANHQMEIQSTDWRRGTGTLPLMLVCSLGYREQSRYCGSQTRTESSPHKVLNDEGALEVPLCTADHHDLTEKWSGSGDCRL